MIDFKPIVSPNLPKRTTVHLCLSPQYPAFTEQLEKLGFICLSPSVCPAVLEPLQLHVDMLLNVLGGGKFVVESSQNKLIAQLAELGFELAASFTLGSEYPADILLNSCVLGDKIICKAENTPQIIKNNRKAVNTKQGYAKCSCAVVDENSIITDDSDIFAKATENGVDALLISKGDVLLSGFEYGFIGGCCGKIAPDTLAFCGDIKTHRNYSQINAFLRDRGVYPLSLCEGRLCDIGSIIPLTEQK